MKKLLAMILVLATVLSLAGCGGDSSAISTATNGQYDETLATNDPSIEETESNVSEPVEVEIEDVSGIVVLVATKDSKKNDFESEIICINPETGNQKTIAKYHHKENTSSMVRLVGDSTLYRYSNLREAFSSDYTKLAVSIQEGANRCVGWIDVDGDIYNLTKELGQMSAGDFADPCKYEVVGFVGEYFVYSEGNSIDVKYYGVPIDNIQPNSVIELTTDMLDIIPQCMQTHISKFPQKYHSRYSQIASWGKGENDHPSDIIDEEHFIVGPNIVNALTGEETVYIPGNSRTNWSGTVNPDGSKIAFLSMKSANDGETGLYITEISGGEPIKISCSLPASVESWDTGAIGDIVTGEGYTNLNVVMCQIIGWK